MLYPGWSSIFEKDAPFELKKNALLTTLPSLPREWMVEFEFKPTNFDHNYWTSIFHMTIGGNMATIGDRIPAVFYHPWRLIFYNEPWQPKRKLSSKLSSTANWQVDQDPSVSGAHRREVQVQDFHYSIYFLEIKIIHYSFTPKNILDNI